MTNDCNLHCEYCSVLLNCEKAGLPMKPNYSILELARFIDRTQKDFDDSYVNIYFFGGEPSLEYEKIIQLIDKIKELLSSKYIVNFVLHTNGLLLNNTPIKVLENLSLIMFSINYEKIPHYQLAPGYFSSIILNAIQIRNTTNIAQIARLTITEKTSLYTEILQVLPFFDLVYWQIENCEKFNDFESFYKSYTFEIQVTFEYWLNALRKGNLIKLVPFMAVLKFMFYHDRNDHEFSCGYSKGMIYVQTNGACFACSDNVESGCHFVGSIAQGVKFKKISLLDLRCKACIYRSICMGRCGRMHKEFSAAHISEYCKLNQYMFNLFLAKKDELKDIIENQPKIKEELSNPLLEFTEFTP